MTEALWYLVSPMLNRVFDTSVSYRDSEERLLAFEAHLDEDGIELLLEGDLGAASLAGLSLNARLWLIVLRRRHRRELAGPEVENLLLLDPDPAARELTLRAVVDPRSSPPSWSTLGPSALATNRVIVELLESVRSAEVRELIESLSSVLRRSPLTDRESYTTEIWRDR